MIRQIPDDQEVYLDKEGFTSIIFDLCVRVGESGSSDAIDGRALTTHLEEIDPEGAAAGELRVWNSGRTVFDKLP
jgi:hypothetical protein